jgi:hypothetical protein
MYNVTSRLVPVTFVLDRLFLHSDSVLLEERAYMTI